MSSSVAQERRESPRHPVRAYAFLMHSTNSWHAHLLDMSANGARLAILEDHRLQPGDDVKLTIEPEDIRQPHLKSALENQSQKPLRLRGTLVHLREHILAVEYRPMSEVDQAMLALLLSQPEH